MRVVCRPLNCAVTSSLLIFAASAVRNRDSVKLGGESAESLEESTVEDIVSNLKADTAKAKKIQSTRHGAQEPKYAVVSGSYKGDSTGHSGGFTKSQEERCLLSTTQSVENPNPTGLTNEASVAMGTVCCDSDGVGSRPDCKTGTYAEAWQHCNSEGKTLCTLAQLKAGAGEASGCHFDGALVWSTDTCEVDKYKAVSGSFKGDKTGHSGGFTKSRSRFCVPGATTAVDNPNPTGITNEASVAMGTVCCDSDGVGSRPGCKTGTYAEAWEHCKSEGMTLCTHDQLKSGAGEASGCHFDGALVWSSNTCEAAYSVVSGSYKGDKTGHSGGFTKSQEERCLVTTVEKVENPNPTGLTDEAEVRMGTVCCDSDGVGSRTYCNTGTWNSADQHCKDKGKTLCTLAQLKAGAGEASGCEFDGALVWSSDTCEP